MSHEPLVQPRRNGQSAAEVVSTPDPEVVPKAERRKFTAEYKQRILAEADACTQRGEIGALLRREGLYRSHLDKWREQRRAGALQALTPQPRGASPTRRRPRSPGCAAKTNGSSSACSGPRQLSRSKKNSQRCSAWRRARATRSHDPNGRRTGGLARCRRRLSRLVVPRTRSIERPATSVPGPRRRSQNRRCARVVASPESGRAGAGPGVAQQRTLPGSGAARSFSRTTRPRALSVLHQHDVPHPGSARRGARAAQSTAASGLPQAQILATGPNQVWSWDITKLRSPSKGVYYYLYVIIDIYSRYVVGWLIAEVEAAELAEQLIAETCAKQGMQRAHLTIHADNGSPMIAKSVAILLADLGVAKSHSRPHVSDDNPYSEAQFKTLSTAQIIQNASAAWRTPAVGAAASSPGTMTSTTTPDWVC